MGKNNQQRRKAKAKERAKARARAREHQGRAGGHGGFDPDPWAGPGGSNPGAGAAFGMGAGARPAWDPGLTVQWLHRWLIEADHGAVREAGRARTEVLRDLRIPARKAAVTAHLTEALLGAVDELWASGWEPADLLRIAGREQSKGAVQVVQDMISLSLSQYADTTVAPRWHDQLREHELTAWWPQSDTPLLARLRSAQSDDDVMVLLADAMSAMQLTTGLPGLQRVEAPPGQWRASTSRSSAGPGATPKMLERVRALLAKAESTPYEAEAETFTAAAQKLMARHSIDQALLAASQPNDQGGGPIPRRVGVDRPYEAPKVALLNAVADANRCRAVWTKELGFVTVVGFADDVAATETLFTSLLVQATRAMTSHGSRRSAWGQSRTRSFRQSFLLAYASRIGQRLQEATQEEVDAHQAQRHAAGPGPGTELVAVLEARAEEVDQTIDDMFGDLQSAGLGSARDAEGWSAGTSAADAANLFDSPALQPQ